MSAYTFCSSPPGAPLVTCADRSSSYAVRVEDPGVEGFPEEALEGFSRGTGP